MCHRRIKMGWILGTSIMIAAGIGYANYNWYKTIKVPYDHVAKAEVASLDGTNKIMLGKDLWRTGNGAVVMVVRRAG